MQALSIASDLNLNDWCIAGGFVRNLVWDQLHDYQQPTPLNDLDVIYYDPTNIDIAAEKYFERLLSQSSDYPWSVKNQARMHLINQDRCYSSSMDAMTYWVETQTAVGISLSHDGELNVLAPFGLQSLFDFSITINPKRPKPETFKRRVADKRWLQTWPRLRVST